MNGTDRLVEGTTDFGTASSDWNFIAARYTQASGTFSYTNLTLTPVSMDTSAAGITAATASASGNANDVIAYSATAPDATMGSLAKGSGGVIGLIDEVRYYDDVRSGSDLASDYNAGVAAIPEPPTSILFGAIGMLGLVRRRH